ncbi:MFS general substrate transporter [Glarea lozoyensis ATCC 20868]|uniref:MFS general substrate transporter n=1 Tax=Glarea lozoyensis (strain ATCC 20868 / MF5171) TaxID=1116229 RepID=S3CHS0_GLAL2|nr:MFS general substrate transporter [Glarea lozoyensis ATCC 20868]EPE24804.1 MFS general substrate transporter [Glarea lozoyensis ATCC 20868]
MTTNPETIAAVPPSVVPGEGQTTKEVSSAHPVYRSDEYDEEIEGELPTEEEFQTLRRVPDKIPWIIYTVAFIELCERFSYYGTTVVFTNFIQQPLPEGSRTGAGFKDGQSGALDKGQRTSTGLTTFNQFWVYLIPLFGAYVADAHLGRYKTIAIALGIAIVGHIILVISAIPPVITKPSTSMGVFIVGLIIMGVGTGAFKPNISPLIAEQLPLSKMVVKELPSGERVIVDPAVTQSRVYSYFYLFINIGALVGQIGMVYCEKYVGFWLAFLLPTVLLCFCPLVLLYGRNKYKQQPPNGSVFSKAMRLFILAQKGKWSINPVSTYKRMNDGLFWEDVKPSNLATARPHWMTFDDKWVDEVKRGFAACTVFCWFPIYWLTYNQLNNNLTSQAAVMKLNGLPNDVLSNLDPFALIILIPICDLFIYPALRKYGIRFTPIKKITAGFFTGSAAMIWACVIQAYIYKYSVCGNRASLDDPATGETCEPVSINVWAQTGAYVLIAISEIFASITSLEYAFSKAPVNMRSLVMSVALFTNAISAAIGEAFVSVSADPLLVWNYGSMAVIAAVGGIAFWFIFRGLDQEEDHLNMLPAGHLVVTKDIEEPPAEEQPVAREIKG